MSVVCIRSECSKTVPLIAIRELDPFCSSRCCRISFGIEEEKPEPNSAHTRNRCKGCGRLTSDDEFTRGCISCKKRKAYRKAKGRLAA